MAGRRASLVIAPGLLALAYSPLAAALHGGEDVAPEAALRPSDPVPETLIGTWVYSHEECEPDSDMTPDKRTLRIHVTFHSAHTYELDIEGFHFEGAYRYEGGNSPRITLDTMVNFDVEGDTLQNWSEGDAVYQCGRVFVRGEH